jgi:hypothetical protein
LIVTELWVLSLFIHHDQARDAPEAAVEGVLRAVNAMSAEDKAAVLAALRQAGV